MLQLTVLSILTYCELFLLRRWLWGTFDAQRPMLMLKTEPWAFLWGEFLFLIMACFIATISKWITEKIWFERIYKLKKPKALQTFFLSLLVSLAAMFAIAAGIERIALGT